jgi:bifunctional non-homologous end joining protein LigD
MLLGSVDKPFSRNLWIAELKHDGWRAITEVRKDGVQIWSKQGRDITRYFPEMQELRQLFRKPVLLDGELCVIDEHGRPRFERLRNRSHLHTLVAFDLLRVGRRMLLDEPWHERRTQLQSVTVDESGVLLLSQSTDDGIALFNECEKRKIEGIVLKRIDAPYRSGRTRNWLKCKTAYGKRVTRARMAHG